MAQTLKSNVGARPDTIADRFPADIGPFTPVPDALYEHGAALDLTGIQRAVIAVLAIHYRRAGDEVWPSLASIARLSGFSESSVKRAIRDLVARGLLRRRREKTSAGAWEVTRYDLAPTWQALAKAHRSQGPVATGQGDPAHRSQGPRPQVTVTHETEAVEAEAREQQPPQAPPRGGRSGRRRNRDAPYGYGPNGRPLDNWGREIAERGRPSHPLN